MKAIFQYDGYYAIKDFWAKAFSYWILIFPGLNVEQKVGAKSFGKMQFHKDRTTELQPFIPFSLVADNN
jgi:hypothetical protein